MSVRIRLLGAFEVSVDGVPVPTRAWARHDAASLVKLLALARGGGASAAQGRPLRAARPG